MRCYSEFKPSIYYLFFSFSWRDLSSFRNVCCILVFLLKLISLISYSSPTFYLFFFHFGIFFNFEIEKTICSESSSFADYFGVLFNQCIGYFNSDTNETHQLFLALLQFLPSFLSHLLTRP